MRFELGPQFNVEYMTEGPVWEDPTVVVAWVELGGLLIWEKKYPPDSAGYQELVEQEYDQDVRDAKQRFILQEFVREVWGVDA